MSLPKDYSGQQCSLARALEIVGERWTLLIARDAFFGSRRFSDFACLADGNTSNGVNERVRDRSWGKTSAETLDGPFPGVKLRSIIKA